MGEAERAIANEIEMKELTGKYPILTHQDEGNECHGIKTDLHRHCRPAWDCLRVVQRPPVRFTRPAETASMKQAADPAQNDPNRRHDCEKVACGLGIPGGFLRDFDAGIPTEQRAENGLTCGPDQPPIWRIPK
jgi:hypothetical protein